MEAPTDVRPKEILTSAKTVLITGSEGRIGKIVKAHISNVYSKVLSLDKALPASTGDTASVDIRNAEEVKNALEKFGPINCIVHLAGDPHPDDSFKPIFEHNVVGTKNILDTAVKLGIKRVIIASSTHTIGGYEGYPSRLPSDRSGKPMTVEDKRKGDSPYGWSKVEIEKMALRYHKKFGLETIILRFGFVTEDDKPAKGYEPHWLSYRDAAQVVQRAIDCDIGYGVYFATSRITPPMFDISNTVHDLKFNPQDSIRVQ